VTPGVTYYFQPIIQSGDGFAVYAYNFGYSGGNTFYNGTADSFNDLWFREGIVVPEPSTMALLLAGVGLSVLRRRNL